MNEERKQLTDAASSPVSLKVEEWQQLINLAIEHLVEEVEQLGKRLEASELAQTLLIERLQALERKTQTLEPLPERWSASAGGRGEDEEQGDDP